MTAARQIDSELGRISCQISRTFSRALKPRERVYSRSMDMLALSFSSEISYRSSLRLLNTVLHRTGADALCLKTFSDHVSAEGCRISSCLDKKATEVLESFGISSDCNRVDPQSSLPKAVATAHLPDSQKPQSYFHDVIEHFNEEKPDATRIKDVQRINQTEIDLDKCVYISIDDVGVNQQKDSRKKDIKSGKIVENTVIHIEHQNSSYVITAIGMKKAFRQLLAFLLSNDLIRDHQIIFFSDGAQNIRKSVESFFAFCPHVLMLDWYHLEKRMTELLSMALKGPKPERQKIRETLASILWAGNVDDAIQYLYKLPDGNIKNRDKLDDAAAYLQRKDPYIPCYAIRGELGYRNSSNPAEKANDLVVAERQKHNGMSWSPSGSGSLAVISAADINNELPSWVNVHDIPFRLNPDDNQIAA